ncbi:hypothetical protein GGH95_001878 [Coemansia sp. RSA 1836]|nr:hypothetical protein GGH95_001878 [Coemansia sp. RSA 1836]
MSASHGQQALDMAASAGISLAVDMAGDQSGQHSHQPVGGMHSAASQSSFGGSSVSNQPIFTTLSFQNSQLQEYDPYTRPQKRAGRTTKPKRTPRPPNAFILYRKAKQAEVIRDNPGVSNKDVSCIIGQMWKSEDPPVQDKFREQAELEKKKHKDMYPNYKYQPRKPKNKRMLDGQGGSTPSGSALGQGQDNGTFSPSSVMSSGLKEGSSAAAASVAAANASYPSYSKYHQMIQQGQGLQHSPAHAQTPASQQQGQLPRGDEYYYRGPGTMNEAQHQHANGGFVPPQLDIKPSFVNALPATAYWTPATPSDAAFSNTLPSGNVFHGGDPASAHMRPFDSVVPQHPGGGHSMGAPSAQIFNSFDHHRQMHHHHHQQQQQQQVHDSQAHMDYQAQQSYHQHHGHPQQQHQSHSAAALGGYVGGGQAYHHSQHGIDGLDGSSVAGADSQGLGLLSPPAVAWSTNM